MSPLFWLFWLFVISAATVASRAATLAQNGVEGHPEGIVQRGNRALLQALNLPATLVLMAVPFTALPWIQATILSLTATFFNPVNLVVRPGRVLRVLYMAPKLNVLSIVGAAYFLIWMSGVLERIAG